VADVRWLVVDANILIRAVLGVRVYTLLEAYAGKVSFLAPEDAYTESRARLQAILAGRAARGIRVGGIRYEEELQALADLITAVPRDVYAEFETDARRRLAGRDQSDWPFLALALRFDCPIWTEDRDFFGVGVATWTTDRVEIYLAA